MTDSEAGGVAVATGDGRQLEVLVSGPSDAMAVVIHMGTPNGLVALPWQLDPGRSGLRTVLYGRPGYGASTPQPGRSVADAVADTAAILDALGVEDFVNVGWSGGGPHALACSALLPTRCLATAVIASPAPYPAEIWPQDGTTLTPDDGSALTAALNQERVQSTILRAEDMVAMFPCAPDRACFEGAYAQWLVSFIRSAWVAGVSGVRDDTLAYTRDWGFDLADAREVTIWHGAQDLNVAPAQGAWLAEHIPAARLRVLPDEGHISIGLHFGEILDDLVARAHTTIGTVT